MAMPPRPRRILGNYTLAHALRVDARRACRTLLPEGTLYHYSQLIGGPPQPEGAYFNAVISWACCIDDSRRPVRHRGDWPVAGRWYPVRTVVSISDGVPGIRILGFTGSEPYYNAFSMDRFRFDGFHPFTCPN
jgi:hypothetical protein